MAGAETEKKGGKLEKLLPPPLRRPGEPGENGANGDGAGARVAAGAKDAPADLLGWMDERSGASGMLTGMLFRKVPKGTNWFYTLGSATLFA
ncbi:MAG: hypothetical protein WBB30_01680, partial [Solirubrobacterales bacterium]